VNVVMNLQFPYNAGNVACFLFGRAKDLSAPLYHVMRGHAVVQLVEALRYKLEDHGFDFSLT